MAKFDIFDEDCEQQLAIHDPNCYEFEAGFYCNMGDWWYNSIKFPCAVIAQTSWDKLFLKHRCKLLLQLQVVKPLDLFVVISGARKLMPIRINDCMEHCCYFRTSVYLYHANVYACRVAKYRSELVGRMNFP